LNNQLKQFLLFFSCCNEKKGIETPQAEHLKSPDGDREYGWNFRRWSPAPTIHDHAGKPGEMGKGVTVPEDRQAEAKEKFKINQFNLVASDLISLNRSLTDVRLSGYVDCNTEEKLIFTTGLFPAGVKIKHTLISCQLLVL
jgi:hypothetical protein